MVGFDVVWGVAWGPVWYGLLEKGDTREGLGLRCEGRQFGEEDQGGRGAREGEMFLG